MKKLTALILAFIMALSLTACGGEEKTETNRLEEIKARGVITVATEPYFAPNEFIDPSKESDAQYVGADIELAQYIADSLGVELQIVPLEFTAVLSSVAEGKYDLAISALAYKPDRADAMNLSKGYYFDEDTEGYGMLCRTEDVDKYPTAADMKDAVIVVQQGSLQQDYVMEQVPEYKELKYVSSMTDAFLMVQEGKADLAACFIGNGRL
ncbi:MAG: transporter substrate-binding domain-containing protein, partial [Oscillospiraceae bacterium]|nr:transporter substrate-binding domain-containing protein [Oscillospiraceae bacterium]